MKAFNFIFTPKKQLKTTLQKAVINKKTENLSPVF